MKKLLSATALMSLLALGTIAAPEQAYGQALVSPIRGLIHEPGQTVNFILRNPTDQPRSYRLEWAEFEQTQFGVGARIPAGAAVPHARASQHLLVAPRQITVAPNTNQTVRVSFRPPAGLPPGEYRSHLLFRVIQAVSSPETSQTVGVSEGVALQIDMHMSVAVPVVVRHQVPSNAQARITQVTPRPSETAGGGAMLQVSLQQQGAVSTQGRVTVRHQATPASPAVVIGQQDNVFIFPDQANRRLDIPLLPEANLNTGILRVTYEGTEEYRGQIWDDQSLRLQ